MLVSPLFSLAFFLALVSAHDGHSRRQVSKRQAQAARYRMRDDARGLGVTDPLSVFDPFRIDTPSASASDSAASPSASSPDPSSVASTDPASASAPPDSASDSASASASTDPASASAPSDSASASGSADPASSAPTSDPASSLPSISLPGATSTNIDTVSPTSDSASASTTDIFSQLSSILSGIISTLTDPPVSTPTSDPASSVPTSDPVSSDIPSSAFSNTITFSASNVITDPPVSSPTSTSASDTLSLPFSLSLPLSDPLSSLPISLPTSDPISISLPTSDPISISLPTSDPFSSLPISISQPFSDPFSQSQSQSSAPISPSQPPPSSVSVSDSAQPPPSSVPVSDSVSGSQPPPSSVPVSDSASQSVSASTPVFPSSPSGPSVSVSVSVTESVSVSTTTTTILQSVASDLTFILTESSLALASVSTTSMSLSNPDAPTTTISFTAAAESALTTAALPSGLPSRIYPPGGLISNPGSNYSFISLLFDGYLAWEFVCQSPVSSTQLFAYVPLLLSAGAGVSTDEIKTFALQVRVPADYGGPQDASELQTLFLAYLPTVAVDPLSLALKSRNSEFYNGVSDPVASALAQHIVSAFALDSYAPPPATGGGGGGGGGSANDAAAGATSQSKTRQDAIIGVVTALGVIAVLVLVFLAFRAFRRRAELAHHRLSDPPEMAGARPDGREFDQDSVGGQRRRSFYFAEDSLRGFQGERADEGTWDSRSPNGMVQRRNVMPAAISAPILQQSSMNW